MYTGQPSSCEQSAPFSRVHQNRARERKTLLAGLMCLLRIISLPAISPLSLMSSDHLNGKGLRSDTQENTTFHHRKIYKC